jgi:hypothetical protein
LAAVLVYLQPPTPWLRRGVVHVAPEGLDAWPGSTRALAVRTIQRGVDMATAGETVLIWPGVYRETIRLRRAGSPGRPLILKAAVPGTALISGTAEPALTRSWRWIPQGRRTFATRVPWRVDALRVDGGMAFLAGSPSLFDDVCQRPGAWPTFQMTSGQTLRLCLPDGSSPSQHRLEINREVPARLRSGGHQVASLWVEAPYVEIRDLVFDLPVTAAIQLWNTSHVRIVGNLFSGADVAINQSSGLRPLKDVMVEHNLSHCYPLYEWRRHGWLTWQQVYGYSNCSLTRMGGQDILIRGNIITQAGDGIKLSPVGGLNTIEANLIAYTTDDGIEFDGPAINLAVRSNLFVDPWVSLGISPVRQGPLRISGNVFLHSRQEPVHGNGVLLKLMGGPIHRVTVDHNLFVGHQLGWSVADSPLSDFHMHNNLLLTVQRVEEGLHELPRMGWRHNRVVRFPPMAWPRPEQGPAGLARVLGRPSTPMRLPGLVPLAIERPGPSWYRPGQEPATRALLPLLGAGWIAPP